MQGPDPTVEIAALAAAALPAGVGLGLLYFSTLWLTVRRLPRQRRPTLWLIASLVVRLSLVLAAFLLLARHGGWPASLAALAGFLLARHLLVRRLRPEPGAGGGTT